jgi:hypothetical protein
LSVFRAQISGNLAELFERGLKIFHDFGGDDVWCREICGVFEGVVFEPEDVDVDLVAFGEVVVGEALEALAFDALVAVLGVIAGDEVVEVGALQLVFFKGEVLVGSEIVDPEFFRPCLFLRRLTVEEEHVSFTPWA